MVPLRLIESAHFHKSRIRQRTFLNFERLLNFSTDVYDVPFRLLRSVSSGLGVPDKNPERSKQAFKTLGAETMLRRRTEQGSTTVALAMAVFLVFMTVITVYIFWAKMWWFPPAITDLGHEIDAQFMRTLLITGVVFVAAQFGLAYAIYRFRDHGQKATYFEGNNTMEIVWTLATVVLFVGLGLYARNAWAQVHFIGASPGALPIEVTAQQFAWNFRYAGPDGQVWPHKAGKGQRVHGQPGRFGPDRSAVEGRHRVACHCRSGGPRGGTHSSVRRT